MDLQEIGMLGALAGKCSLVTRTSPTTRWRLFIASTLEKVIETAFAFHVLEGNLY